MVPPSKRVSLWLGINSVPELREGEFSRDEEVPIIPDQMGVLPGLVAQRFFYSSSGDEAKIAWQGPASLVHIYQYDRYAPSLGKPLESAFEIVEEVTTNSLHPLRLQFLQPPQCLSTLVGQHVCIAEPWDFDDIDEDENEHLNWYLRRRRRLNAKNTSNALEMALVDPMQLTPIQCHRVRDAVLLSELVPIDFSEPFARFFMASPIYVNRLHPIGRTLFRCLAALAIAERDDRISQQVFVELQTLSESILRRVFYYKDDYLSPGSKLPCETIATNCVRRVFEIVEQNKLIEGFVSPEIPNLNEWVPDVNGGAPKEEQPIVDDASCIGNPFGKVLIELPRRDSQQTT